MADSSLTVDLYVSAAAFRLADDEYDWKAQGSGEAIPPRWKKWKDATDEKLYALQGALGTDSTATLTPAAIGLSGEAEAVAAGDFAASAGWDITVVDEASGTIAQFQFAITGGEVQEAPQTITLTWPTELPAAPKMVIPVRREVDANSTITGWDVTTLSTTALVLTTIGNPATGVTETVDVLVIF